MGKFKQLERYYFETLFVGVLYLYISGLLFTLGGLWWILTAMVAFICVAAMIVIYLKAKKETK